MADARSKTCLSFVHPALTVSNITTFIKVTLNLQTGQYVTWFILFQIHPREYQVLDHILFSDVSSPIQGCGHTILSSPFSSLSLNNVLHALQLIKNLVYVRQFIIDNNTYIEFYSFKFFVKNFRTGIPIMRCNSSDDLYPIIIH